MAKKKTTARTKKTTRRTTKRTSANKDRGKRTIADIQTMAGGVVKSSLAIRDPHVDIPLRTVGNTRFNKKRRMLEMGGNTQRRNLFNLGQAKKFMQTMLLAKGCKCTT
jgi:DNA topoisomerase-6 subunit A